jgi:uncharacterized protein (TIGR02246 family)
MRGILALILFALAVDPVAAMQADDERAIREVQARWDDAWNRHDVKALSALVADDVRFVNVAGIVLTTRKAFEELQARTHATQFKESVRTVTSTEIKFLTPDIAVAHVTWGMRGDRNADGTARRPRTGLMMQVLMKRDGAWTIVAAQNTDVR